MDVTVVVGTFGDAEWIERAQRAVASARGQSEVLLAHRDTLAEARNYAAAGAQTEWLCFLDADDELAPGYMDAMAAAEADLRCPATIYIRGRREYPPKLWPECDLRDGNYLVVGTLVRRDLFHHVGGFRDWLMYEDWDLWQRCWRAGASIEQVPEAIYRAHVREDSRNRAPAREERLRVHHEIRRANFPELYADTA